jgi:hypothetical protein
MRQVEGVTTALRKRIAAAIMTVAVCAAVACGDDDDKEVPTAFGRDCYEDVPCEEGLACSDVDNRATFQCTTRCDSSEECRDRYGSALCSEGGYCVRDCDANCPDDQSCNSNGWCA